MRVIYNSFKSEEYIINSRSKGEFYELLNILFYRLFFFFKFKFRENVRNLKLNYDIKIL